jgi:hypothetical protein
LYIVEVEFIYDIYIFIFLKKMFWKKKSKIPWLTPRCGKGNNCFYV